jgi:hypothetical protein
VSAFKPQGTDEVRCFDCQRLLGYVSTGHPMPIIVCDQCCEDDDAV